MEMYSFKDWLFIIVYSLVMLGIRMSLKDSVRGFAVAFRWVCLMLPPFLMAALFSLRVDIKEPYEAIFLAFIFVLISQATISVYEDRAGIRVIRINPKSEREFSKRVFIVHGRDEVLRDSVRDFIEKLGLQPIILADQASLSRTIIEKIEDYSDVGYAVVLYTGCDVGQLRSESPLNPRARQNVVFEHGYFISKLGRKRVAAIVDPEVERPNDIAGVLYLETTSDWRTLLMRELRELGYEI